MTATSATTISSGGLRPAVVGGIAAGIVGAFLLIGALLFFVAFRKPRTPEYDPNIALGSPRNANVEVETPTPLKYH